MGNVDEYGSQIGRIGGEYGLTQDHQRDSRKRDHYKHHAIEGIALGLIDLCLRGKAVRRFHRHREPRRALRIVTDDERCRLAGRELEGCDHLRIGDRPGAERAILSEIEQRRHCVVAPYLVDRDFLGEIGMNEEAPVPDVCRSIRNLEAQPYARRCVAEVGYGAGKRAHSHC